MAKSKVYYGFRFFAGRNTTMGHPNKITGKYSIAGQMFASYNKEKFENWLANEKRDCVSGNGGGERIKCTKAELRSLNLGDTIEEFEDEINFILRYEDAGLVVG